MLAMASLNRFRTSQTNCSSQNLRSTTTFHILAARSKPLTPDVSHWSSLATRAYLIRYRWIWISLVLVKQERCWPGLFTVAPIWRAFLTSLPKYLEFMQETPQDMYELTNPLCKRNFSQKSAIQTPS